MLTGQSSWFEFLREALAFVRAFQEKTKKTCPYDNCPLRLNKRKLTQDQLVQKHKEMYRKNHPRVK